MRRPWRAQVLHGYADVAVANTAVRLHDAAPLKRRRTASLQRLIVGSLATLDRSAHDAEEEGGVDRCLGLIGPGGADEAERAAGAPPGGAARRAGVGADAHSSHRRSESVADSS